MKRAWPVLVLLVTLGAAIAAHADGEVADLERLMGGRTDSTSGSPAVVLSGEADDNTIRITPDSTKIVRLDQDASSVIVANPAHASIVLDSPRLLVVMPRTPGTTAFTVLNGRGEVILEKNVIVSGTAKPQYVRVRKACGTADTACVPNSYYYCPDGCYEVTTVDGAGTPDAPPIVSSGANSPDGAATAAGAEPPPPPTPEVNGEPAPPAGRE